VLNFLDVLSGSIGATRPRPAPFGGGGGPGTRSTNPFWKVKNKILQNGSLFHPDSPPGLAGGPAR